ncbi:transglutaminase family protein [Calidifontibacter sp. DB0510]|uniref:Transglutaminase family protein n=1 Tax=Metallococcus carri TaxID=1656884 RepID=A0A967E854_9MICO|nr:transglutaminase family protein [Metallococcus carri]NHN54857.1 transglutaminase family protein [Metallococcus carri]NOP37202.1 transglutaminase family protein [Calidifontibacter sp. DB2511S]
MSEDLHATRGYEVRHRTEYTYEDYVTASYSRACLRPRATGYQRVLSNVIEVSPGADVLTEHTDFWGNYSHYLEVRTRHTVLAVDKTSRVSITWPRVDLDRLNEWTVGSAADAFAARPDAVDTGFLLPSRLVALTPAVRAYAAEHLPRARPLGDALAGVYGLIYGDFTYAKGSTSTTTTLDEILGEKQGVCQDFAHLGCGMLRAAGLPARYVSGYIETTPPPGKPKLAGSDATHAWVSCAVPGGDWVDLDPTNNHFADSRYIVTAWGRDFRDVSPLKGVIFTESGGSKLKVAVDVIPLKDRPAMMGAE